VQKRGGAAKSEIIDVAVLNAKFDEVYERGGIYNFMSHPQWLDYGPDGFYERHLAHVGRRRDVWYVPMGPLYAYRTIAERTQIQELAPSRFSVVNDLDPVIYDGSITLEFQAPAGMEVFSNGRKLEPAGDLTDRWNKEYVRRDGERWLVTVRSKTMVEFRPAAPAAAVAGLWKAGDSAFELKTEGGKITGTLSSPRGRASILEGTVSGNDVRFTIVRTGNGDEMKIRYRGRVEGDTMYLRMQYGTHEPREVTARRSRP
jgi:hypothetical protein